MRTLLLFLVLALLGCSASVLDVQKATANAMAITVNDSTGVLLARYEEEGNEAIDKAKTAEEARDALDQVRARWVPTWLALETFRIAHGEWAAELERGEVACFECVLKAYCVVAPIAELPTKEFCP